MPWNWSTQFKVYSAEQQRDRSVFGTIVHGCRTPSLSLLVTKEVFFLKLCRDRVTLRWPVVTAGKQLISRSRRIVIFSAIGKRTLGLIPELLQNTEGKACIVPRHEPCTKLS